MIRVVCYFEKKIKKSRRETTLMNNQHIPTEQVSDFDLNGCKKKKKKKKNFEQILSEIWALTNSFASARRIRVYESDKPKEQSLNSKTQETKKRKK